MASELEAQKIYNKAKSLVELHILELFVSSVLRAA